MDYKKDSMKFLAGSVLTAFVLYFFIYYCLLPIYSKLYLLAYLNRHLSMDEIENLIMKNYSFIFFHMRIKDDLIVSAVPYFSGFIMFSFFSSMLRTRYDFFKPRLGVALYYFWAAFIGLPYRFVTLVSPFVMFGFPLRYKILAVIYFIILIVIAAWVSGRVSDLSLQLWKRTFEHRAYKKAAIAAAATLVAAIVVMSVYAYAIIPLGTPSIKDWPNASFSSDAWRETQMIKRYMFYKDIVHNKTFDGLSKQGVLAILGKPDNISPECRYALYVLKWDRTGIFGFDKVYSMKINFDQACRESSYFVQQW